MSLIDVKDLEQVSQYKGIGKNVLHNSVFKLLKLDLLNELYLKHESLRGIEFLDRLLEELEINIDFDLEDLSKIPKHGKFISISNHPYGALDGVILIKLLTSVRPEYKVLANFLLNRIEPLKPYVIPLNPFSKLEMKGVNLNGLRSAINFLDIGNPIGLFPAGEVSNFNLNENTVVDKQWDDKTIKFIKYAKAPILPIYFDGANSWKFQLLGLLHPHIRTAKLPSELLNKKNRTIKVRIGQAISVEDQNKFTNIAQFGRYLRSMTYMQGVHEEYNIFKLRAKGNNKKQKEIVAELDQKLLIQEVESLSPNNLLFKQSNKKVFCCRSEEIPYALREIGRLREITFRDIGEGTNYEIDIDEYDLYYSHLFIWDDEFKRIVGAYRVCKGREVFSLYGKKGFYLNSLFKFEKDINSLFQNSIELGRSFIRKEYQGKSNMLFLLWKGILYYLMKHPEYRYLIGPVSISGEMSKVSKTLLVEFLRKNHFNNDMAKFVKARKDYKIKLSKKIDTDVVLESIGTDVKKLDKLISEIEKGRFKFPVLLKKYIAQNAELIGFNVDPKFNNSLDGLIVLDLYKVPESMIKHLAKEIDEDFISNRFEGMSLEFA